MSIKPFYSDKWVTIYHGDCREILPTLDVKVDLVLTDPPYGVTHNKWDVCQDLTVWIDNNLAVIFSQQPFTTTLIANNPRKYRYDLIWNKVLTTGFLNANLMPLRQHETILVFGDIKYNPQKIVGAKNHSKGISKRATNNNYGAFDIVDNADELGVMKHPGSILEFAKPHPAVALHPTEKPAGLMLWLIETYSDENQTILDPFLGSGTTCYCAKKLNRYSIGIEIEERYCEIAANRCRQSVMELNI